MRVRRAVLQTLPASLFCLLLRQAPCPPPLRPLQNGQAMAEFASEQHIASIAPWEEEEGGQAAPQLPPPARKE